MYTCRYDGLLYEERVARINSLKLNVAWSNVFGRLYPGKVFKNLNSGGENEQAFYNGISVFTREEDGSLTPFPKDDYITIQSEFSDFKSDLIASLDPVYTKLQKEYDIRNAIMALKYWKAAVDAEGTYSQYNNKEELIKRLILEEDLATVANIQTAHAVIDASAQENSLIKKRVNNINFGAEVVATIAYLNESNNITPEQTLAIMSDQSIRQILSLLQVGSIESARPLIVSLDLTNLAPLTETERTKILAKIDEYLG